MKPEALSLDHLVRVLIAHGAPVPADLDRVAVVAAVDTINTVDGAVLEFPPCFAREFDGTDESCSDVCDFRKECEICFGADSGHASPHFNPRVESQLVLLKRRAHRQGDESPPPAHRPVLVTPAPTLDVAPLGPSPPKTKVAKPMNPETARTLRASMSLPPAFLPSGASPDIDGGIKPTKASKTVKKKPQKAAVSAKPSKSTKQERKRARSAEPPPVDLRVKQLSNRKAVFPNGQTGYSLTEDGRRYVRAPQGSSTYLATLPRGTVLERERDGKLWRVRKDKLGRTTEHRDGRVRKRDGRWTIFEVYAITASGERGPRLKKHEGFSGSLNQVAFHITGANNWSGAKFFGVLPPELRPGHPKYDPSAAVGQSFYRFEGA